MRSVPSLHRPVLILAIIFMALGCVYSLVVPIFEAPDEVFHVAYARYVAQHLALPVQGAGKGEEAARQEASQPPLYYILASPLLLLIDTSDFDTVARLNPHAAPGQPKSDGNKNMVVPTVSTFPWHGTRLAVHVLRLFSLFLGLITLLATYGLGLTLFATPDGSGRGLAWAMAAFVAFNAEFAFINASVNNDNLMSALAAVTLLLVVRMAAQRTVQALPLRHVILIAVLAGLAALTKLTGVLLCAFVAFSFVMIGWRSCASSKRPWWLHTLAALFLFGLIVAAIAGWWYLRNWLLYRDVTGLQPMLQWVGQRSLSLSQLFSELEGLELSFWAVFGWFNILVSQWIYRLLQLLTRLALIGFALLIVMGMARRVLRRRQPATESTGNGWPFVRLLPLALALIWVGIVTFGLARWTATTPGTQGRLLFPAIGGIAALLVTGLALPLPKLLRRLALAVVLGALLIFAAVAPFRYIEPAYARPPVMTAEEATFQHPTHLDYGDKDMQLVGFSLDRDTVSPGENVSVTLYLEGLKPLDQDYSLFIHLWGEDMQWLGQRDSYPGRGSYPTSEWTPGAVIEDRYIVSVAPTATVPARVQIEVGFYDFSSGDRLLATTPDGTTTEIPMVGRMKVATAMATESELLPARAVFGGQASLISAQAEIPPVVQAGSLITVTTMWQALAPLTEDYTIFLQVVDATPRMIAQKDQQPQAGTYPTGLWSQGEVVTDQRTLTLPNVLPPGNYRIVTGLYRFATGERLPVSTDLGIDPQQWAVIGEFTVR